MMTTSSFFMSMMGSLVQDDVPWDTRPPLTVPMPPVFTWMRTYLELIIAGLGLLAALVLFSFYFYGFIRQRMKERHNRIKRKYWTVDKVNACLIPLGIAVGFAGHYFMSR